jgi:DNA-3-methyladenine glycosylase II
MDIAAAKKHLKKSDSVMAQVVTALPLMTRSSEPDAWRALTSSIIGQQISVHAARAVRGRFAALENTEFVSPHFVLATDDETLRGAGLSRAKVLAVRDLAARLEDGRLQPERFAAMSDEEVIAALIPTRGIGRWTAEMFLMWSLGREDVLAVDDLGLRNAMKRLYNLPELSASEMRRLAEPWRPYRSVASMYLWRWLDNTPKIAA